MVDQDRTRRTDRSDFTGIVLAAAVRIAGWLDRLRDWWSATATGVARGDPDDARTSKPKLRLVCVT